jgi:hypothetical protein
MSQAASYAPAGPDQPAPRPRRSRLLLVPGGIVLLLIAIPGGTYAFAENQLSQAQTSASHGAYSRALSEYGTVQTVAGNPVSRLLLGEVADRAKSGTAETHYRWGVQLTEQKKFADSETQLRGAIKVGIADWAVRGNAALADLFYAWAQSLVADKQFQDGIDKYHQVAAVDPTGNLTASTNAGLASAYAGFAQWYLQQQPIDYPNALMWYQKLVKDLDVMWVV